MKFFFLVSVCTESNHTATVDKLERKILKWTKQNDNNSDECFSIRIISSSGIQSRIQVCFESLWCDNFMCSCLLKRFFIAAVKFDVPFSIAMPCLMFVCLFG